MVGPCFTGPINNITGRSTPPPVMAYSRKRSYTKAFKRRFISKRPFKRFRKASFVHKVARIARRAVGSEGKIFHNSGSNNIGNYETRYNNIMWDLAAGTGQPNVIGEQCLIKGFRLNFEFKIPVTTASSAIHSFNVRVMVIRWRDFKTGSLINQFVDDTVNQAQYYRNTGNLFTSPPNTDQIGRVLKDVVFTIRPEISGQAISIFRKMWIPINKNYRYESGGLGEGRDYNYYVVVTAAQVDSTFGFGNGINATLTKTIYFRDA